MLVCYSDPVVPRRLKLKKETTWFIVTPPLIRYMTSEASHEIARCLGLRHMDHIPFNYKLWLDLFFHPGSYMKIALGSVFESLKISDSRLNACFVLLKRSRKLRLMTKTNELKVLTNGKPQTYSSGIFGLKVKIQMTENKSSKKKSLLIY